MSFLPPEQRKYDNYLSQFKSCEAEALAHVIATLLTFADGLFPVDKIIADAQKNTQVIRHNRQVRSKQKALERLKKLCEKTNPTRAEAAEALNLCKKLKIDLDDVELEA